MSGRWKALGCGGGKFWLRNTVAATWEGSSVMGERVAVNEDGGIFSLFESVSEAMTCFVGL